MMILPGSGLKAGDGKPDFGGVMGVPVASPTVGGDVVGFISIKAPANAGPAKPTSAAEAIRSFRIQSSSLCRLTPAVFARPRPISDRQTQRRFAAARPGRSIAAG